MVALGEHIAIDFKQEIAPLFAEFQIGFVEKLQMTTPDRVRRSRGQGIGPERGDQPLPGDDVLAYTNRYHKLLVPLALPMPVQPR